MGRRFAGVLGLTAFSVSLLRAACLGINPPDALTTSTLLLFAFAGVGALVGTVAERTILESVRWQFEQEMKAAEAESQVRPGGKK